MKTMLLVAALLASSLAIPSRAHAAPSDADDASSALVDQAARAYDQNQLDEALRLLARAYELSPRPSILYNQAQVFRAKDDCAGALDAYTRFIAATTPDDPNRERAQQRRAEMQACVEKRGGAVAAPPEEAPPEESATAPETSTTPPASVQLALTDPSPPPVALNASPAAPADAGGQSRRRIMRLTGWTLVGAGVLAAGAAAALAWEAHNIQEELQAEINEPSPGPWTEHERGLEEDGRSYANLARWLGAAAALAGGGGAALLIVSRPAAGTTHAATTLIGWSGTF